jgi:hypothetical protein
MGVATFITNAMGVATFITNAKIVRLANVIFFIP